jgi:hypothetical protein
MPTTMTRETRSALAEYNVLAAYHRKRQLRYGDMAHSRRGRELDRLAKRVVDAGVHVGPDGHLPASTRDELVAAWDRVARPRIARVRRETFRADTKYSRATLAAWADTARILNIPA